MSCPETIANPTAPPQASRGPIRQNTAIYTPAVDGRRSGESPDRRRRQSGCCRSGPRDSRLATPDSLTGHGARSFPFIAHLPRPIPCREGPARPGDPDWQPPRGHNFELAQKTMQFRQLHHQFHGLGRDGSVIWWTVPVGPLVPSDGQQRIVVATARGGSNYCAVQPDSRACGELRRRSPRRGVISTNKREIQRRRLASMLVEHPSPDHRLTGCSCHQAQRPSPPDATRII